MGRVDTALRALIEQAWVMRYRQPQRLHALGTALSEAAPPHSVAWAWGAFHQALGPRRAGVDLGRQGLLDACMAQRRRRVAQLLVGLRGGPVQQHEVVRAVGAPAVGGLCQKSLAQVTRGLERLRVTLLQPQLGLGQRPLGAHADLAHLHAAVQQLLGLRRIAPVQARTCQQDQG